MIVKIVLLFLAVLAILAMFGRLRLPGQRRLSSLKCPDCGAFRVGKGPCPCGRA